MVDETLKSKKNYYYSFPLCIEGQERFVCATHTFHSVFLPHTHTPRCQGLGSVSVASPAVLCVEKVVTVTVSALGVIEKTECTTGNKMLKLYIIYMILMQLDV